MLLAYVINSKETGQMSSGHARWTPRRGTRQASIQPPIIPIGRHQRRGFLVMSSAGKSPDPDGNP